MNLRKIFGLALISLTFLFFISGCGIIFVDPALSTLTQISTQNQPDPSKTTTSTSPATSTPVRETPTPEATPTRQLHLDIDLEQLDGIAITLMHPWQDERARQLGNLVDTFNQTNEWGIRVNLDNRNGSDELFAALQGNIHDSDLPEITMIYPFQAEQLDSSFFWLDLTDYIYDDVWGLDEAVLADLPSYNLESQVIEGRLIGFPAYTEANVLFYNLTWANELGFSSVPTTPQQLKEQTCAAYQDLLADDNLENDGTGGLLLNTNPESVLSWYHAFNGKQLQTSGELSLDNAQGQNAFDYVKDFYDEGCAWVGRLSQPYNYFADRYALVYAGTTGDIMQQKDAFAVTGSSDEWVIISYPGEENEGSLLLNNLSYVVTVNKPEVQLASWIFIRWMASDPAAQEFRIVAGSWPLTDSQKDSLEITMPWSGVSQENPQIYHIPIRIKWTVERMILQDAFSRMLILDASSLPVVLEMMDETLAEIYEMSFDGD